MDPWGLGSSRTFSRARIFFSTHHVPFFSTTQEFILSCLARDPARRPSAHNLLFHRVLFEVHSLKLLAAHCFIQHQCEGQKGRDGPGAWGQIMEGSLQGS